MITLTAPNGHPIFVLHPEQISVVAFASIETGRTEFHLDGGAFVCREAPAEVLSLIAGAAK